MSMPLNEVIKPSWKLFFILVYQAAYKIIRLLYSLFFEILKINKCSHTQSGLCNVARKSPSALGEWIVWAICLLTQKN